MLSTRLLFGLALLLVAFPSRAQVVALDSVAVGGSMMGGPGGGPFTLVSLRDARVVSNADSATTAWDIGLRGTTILVNGGTSGPGEGAAAVVEAAFDDVDALHAASLRADGEGDCPRGEPLAICTGSGNGWYLYAGNGVEPLAGRTLVVRTADGSAPVRLRVVRYTLSAPLADGSRPRYYALEFAPLGAE